MKKNRLLDYLARAGWKKWVQIMKLTAFLILLFVVNASASFSQSTKISVKVENGTLSEIFSKIEAQSEYRFFYQNEQIRDLGRKTVDVSNKNILDIVNELLKETELSCKLVDRNIIIFPKYGNPIDNLIQQSRSVSGKVIDSSGGPLPGVSVVVKGTTNGTITDSNGNYTLPNVPADAILQYSFVGMKSQELRVAGKSTINITMTDETIGIDEVVAIGYGTQKKATITGSIATIDGKKLAEAPVVNLSNNIAGQLPGVIVNSRSGNPGDDDAKILIRGKGTTGSTDALIVIDGIPDRGGFSRLNPKDIESYTVLKDASAAIYGARAANGVILITTKRGQAGKPDFSFDNSVGWSQPTRTPDLLDSWQYATAQNEYADNFSGQAHKWTPDDITKFKDGSSPLTHPNTDWIKVLLKDWSVQSNHSVSVRGGTEAIRYFVSGQYLYQSGNFVNGDHNYDQIQWRANLDANLTKSFSAGFDMAYRKEKRNWLAMSNMSDFWSEVRSVYPYLIPYYPNGYAGLGLTAGGNMAKRTSPDAGYDKRINDILNSKVTFRWVLPVKGLALTGYGAYDLNFFNQKQFNNVWNEYTYNSETQVYTLVPSSSVINLTLNKDDLSTTTIHTQLEYKNSFGKHNVDAFVAYEQSEYKYSHLYAYRDGFPSGSVDQLFAGADNANKTNDGYEATSGRVNYFGRVNYDFAGKYLAGVTLRYDGSQNFPKGKRFGTFPGVSLGWRLSEESFVKENLPFVNNLKLRASWGILGNDNVNQYQYLASYKYGTNAWWWWKATTGHTFGDNLNYVKSFIESGTPNPNITWEKATTTNIALEGSLFNNKLDFDIDVFRSERSDILAKRDLSVPAYTGLTLPDENIGKVLNKGIEIQLTHRNKLTDDLSYLVSGNFSFVRNKVKYLDEAPLTPDYQKKEGYPIDSWMLYEADGLFQTQAEVDNYPHIKGTGPGDVKLIDVNNDGTINEKDQVRKFYGVTPEIVYGLNLGVTYKNFDLSVLFQGQAHAYLMVKPNRLNYETDYFDGRWQKQGDSEYPRTFCGPTVTSGQSSYNSTFWLKSAAFLRLKNVYLSYNLPKHWMEAIHLSGAKVFVSGANLFTLDKIKFFDPELNSNDGLSYSLQRTIQLGLNLNF